MKKVLFMLLMIVGVVYGQKVMLFDLSKYELISKEKGLESYKIGDIIFTTDIKYNTEKRYYEKGSKLIFERKDSFEDMMFIYKRYDNNRTGVNVEIVISDDFGEVVKVRNQYGNWYLGDERFKVPESQETLKLVFNNKKLFFYRNSELLNTLNLSHLNENKKIEVNLIDRVEVIYDFKIVAEN